MKIDTTSVVIDETVYPRSSMSEFLVHRMMEALDSGSRFPPIVIEAGSRRLVDGRHRLEVSLRKGIMEIDADEKAYPSEAEMFADAVRLNISHGAALTAYDIKVSIARLQALGFQREQIGEVVRIGADKIDTIVKGFAAGGDGQPLALKGGLRHMRGTTLSEQQIAAQRRYGGGQAVFYVRQIKALLEADMWPTHSDVFATEMDELIVLWRAARGDSGAADA